MSTATELLRQGRRKELWDKYCGFLDLTLDEFMYIQEHLLVEQLRLLADSKLGRALMGGTVPLTAGEFRRTVPITTYEDYVPYLNDQREDVLPMAPYCWMRTSGRTGQYRGKWVPCSEQFFEQLSRLLLSTTILASAREKGDILIEEGDTLLYAAAPPPYITGTTMRAAEREFPWDFVPPTHEAEQMSFQERLEQGFFGSMGTGIDHFVGVASVLLRIGEAFTEGSSQMTLSPQLLRPHIVYRIGKAYVASKLKGRQLLPKDLWNPKGIVASGMDVKVYKDAIAKLWGRTPLEAYACTEFGGIAIEPWGGKSQGLVFVPDSAFWELMPESEYAIWKDDRSYRPQTRLLNEVQPGRYVLIGTSFSGGAFVRYCVGDMVSIVATRDKALGIELPQMVMESRIDDVINLAGMVLLTERALWRGFGHLDLPVMDWTARKEFDGNGAQPTLHVYVEGLDEDPHQLAADLHEALVNTIDDYAAFDTIMRTNPVRVTHLARGTFQRYLEEKQAQDADLGQLKPPRMAADGSVDQLLRISQELGS